MSDNNTNTVAKAADTSENTLEGNPEGNSQDTSEVGNLSDTQVQAIEGNPETSTEGNTSVENEGEPKGEHEGSDLVTSFEDLQEAYANGTVSEADLRNAVHSGTITKEQFADICAVPFDESDEDEPQKSLQVSFDTLKAQLEERIKEGKLNAAGALATIPGKVSRNEISEDTAKQITDWLKSVMPEGSVSNGTNFTGDAVQIAEVISETYHPEHESLEKAANAAASIVTDKIKQDAEFEGTKTAALVISLADIAFYLLKDGELAVTFREVPFTLSNGKKGMARFCRMHADLWGKVKSRELLGQVETVTTTVGGKIREEGKVFDPYNDRSIAPMVKLATMKACLIAYGEQTGVRFGYVNKKQTSTGRMSRKMIVEEAIPDGKKASDYYKIVAAPYNALVPKIWAHYEDQRKTISDTADGPTEKLVTFTALKAIADNPDDSLRWLPDEAVEPLYQHYFAKHTLVFHTSERGDKKIPTGSIVGSHDPNFPPSTRQREQGKAAPDDVTKLREEVSKLKGDKIALEVRAQKAEAGINHDDLLRTLQAIAGRTRNVNLSLADAAIATEVDVAMAALERAEQKMPGNDALYQFVKLAVRLDGLLDYDNQEDRWYFVKADGIRHPIKRPGDNGQHKQAA